MNRHAKDLFVELLKDAIDCTTLHSFNYYKDFTTAYANRKIIELMEPNRLYRYEDRLFVRVFDRMCFIFLNKHREELPNVGTLHEMSIDPDVEPSPETVRILLPFSPKHICGGQYTSGHLKRISNYFEFNQVISSLIKD